MLRAPYLTNLRMDPFERARQEDAMGYQRWYLEHMYAIAPASAYVAGWLQSFKEFPQKLVGSGQQLGTRQPSSASDKIHEFNSRSASGPLFG